MKADQLLALLERGYMIGSPEEWKKADAELMRRMCAAKDKRDAQFFIELVKAFRIEAKKLRISLGQKWSFALIKAQAKLRKEGNINPYWGEVVDLAKKESGLPEIHERRLREIRREIGASDLPNRPRGSAKKGGQKK